MNLKMRPTRLARKYAFDRGRQSGETSKVSFKSKDSKSVAFARQFFAVVFHRRQVGREEGERRLVCIILFVIELQT